jgi:hypothetical protein
MNKETDTVPVEENPENNPDDEEDLLYTHKPENLVTSN